MPERSRVLRGPAAFAVSLLAVLLIAVLKSRGVVTDLDRGIMGAMGAHRGGAVGQAVTAAMIVASLIGDTAGRIVMVLAVSAWLGWRGRGAAAWWLIAVTLGGTLLNMALKQAFATPRPDLLPHLDMVRSYSFPSGHAAGNLIFFGALAMLVRNGAARALAVAMILWIGVSRIWLGVHWPSDVAGWIEGVGWLALCSLWLSDQRGETIPFAAENGPTQTGR